MSSKPIRVSIIRCTYLNLVWEDAAPHHFNLSIVVLKSLDIAYNPEMGTSEIKRLANFIRLYSPPLKSLAIGQLVMGDDLAIAFSKVRKVLYLPH